MPTKKRVHAYEKYQSKRYPAAVRETAADLALVTRARKKIGKLALGKPKTSKVHRDYAEVNRAYQSTGKKLARLTGYKWKTKRK